MQRSAKRCAAGPGSIHRRCGPRFSRASQRTPHRVRDTSFVTLHAGLGNPRMAQRRAGVLTKGTPPSSDPTPPGTGGVSPATFKPRQRRHRRTSLILPSARQSVDADIDHGRPGLIQSPRTISAFPTAAQTRSRGRTTAQDRGSANARSSPSHFHLRQQLHQGRPTRLERPMTMAFMPSSDACTLLARIMQPSGCTATAHARPPARRPRYLGAVRRRSLRDRWR